MQMPIPQNGARSSPFTDSRHRAFVIIIAAATLVSSETCTSRPFTEMVNRLFIDDSSFSNGQRAAPSIAYNFCILKCFDLSVGPHYSGSIFSAQLFSRDETCMIPLIQTSPV